MAVGGWGVLVKLQKYPEDIYWDTNQTPYCFKHLGNFLTKHDKLTIYNSSIASTFNTSPAELGYALPLQTV